MLLVAAAVPYWLANYNNRLPTPLDGMWRVVEVAGGDSASVPTQIYFERNRAFMAVFRFRDSWITHHFEVDPERKTLRIWDKWLAKGDEVFTGTYDRTGDRLELHGRFGGSGTPVRLRLERRG